MRGTLINIVSVIIPQEISKLGLALLTPDLVLQSTFCNLKISAL